MGGEAESHQRAVRRVDRRPEALGLLGGHLLWQRRHQDTAARRDLSIPQHQVPFILYFFVFI